MSAVAGRLTSPDDRAYPKRGRLPLWVEFDSRQDTYPAPDLFGADDYSEESYA